MFLISNDENLTIPNFLQALGFIPPAGMDIDEIFIEKDNVPQVNQTLENSGFQATAINPNYKTVKYQRKDPKRAFSFSDNYVVPETVAAELAEFPKHIQANPIQDHGPTPQYKIIKSPVRAVSIVEDTVNNCYMLRMNEDYLFPKGTVLKMTENESELSDIKYAGETEDGVDELGKYATAALYATLLANDLKTMHLHAVGDDFDKIHQISEVLYQEAESESDELSELAIANGEKIPNKTFVAQFVDTETEWPALNGDTFNWPQFVAGLQKAGEKYLSVLKDVKDDAVTDMITFWEKEINYKNAARGFGHDNDYCEADFRDNLTDPELQFNTNQNNPDDLSDATVDMYIYNDERANNNTWNGYEPMTTSMVVTGGEEVTEDDLANLDTSIQEFEPDTTDYASGFSFDDVENEDEKNE